MQPKKHLKIEELIATRDQLLKDLKNVEIAKANIEGGINVLNNIIKSHNVKQ